MALDQFNQSVQKLNDRINKLIQSSVPQAEVDTAKTAVDSLVTRIEQHLTTNGVKL